MPRSRGWLAFPWHGGWFPVGTGGGRRVGASAPVLRWSGGNDRVEPGAKECVVGTDSSGDVVRAFESVGKGSGRWGVVGGWFKLRPKENTRAQAGGCGTRGVGI